MSYNEKLAIFGVQKLKSSIIQVETINAGCKINK